MKNLITTTASLLLLMLFVLQFAGNQMVHNRLFRADMAIDAFRDMAKEQGYVSEENSTILERALIRICDCDPGMISISGTGAMVERGGLVYYQVRFPLRNLIAAGAALGIVPEENMAWFDDEGWVVSRYEREPEAEEDEAAGEEETTPPHGDEAANIQEAA